MIGRSSAYAAKFIVTFHVRSVSLYFPCCSHRRSGSTKIITKYGDVGVSLSIVPLCIGIFCV